LLDRYDLIVPIHFDHELIEQIFQNIGQNLHYKRYFIKNTFCSKKTPKDNSKETQNIFYKIYFEVSLGEHFVVVVGD